MRLQELMQKGNIDLFLTINPDSEPKNPTMAYLTGYGSSGVLALAKTNKPLLVVPSLEFERAKLSSARVIQWKGSALESIKKSLPIVPKRIGFEESKLPVKYLNAMKKVFKAKFVPIDSLLEEAKMIKSSSEVEIYEDASKITKNVLDKMIDNFSSFKKESDVVAFLTNETAKFGATLSFPTIVASGKNASMPHYDTRAISLEKGFCIIDFGILYKNYCTDVSRTVFVGSPSKNEKELYDKVLRVQEECIDLSLPGVKCSSVHLHAEKVLGKAFCHSLGHGIGTEVHESPNLSPKSTHVFENNMAFTIEPGVYYPKKCGIRIEDDILMLKNKPKVLSKTTKELVCV